MLKLAPYLGFDDGLCAEATRFYETALGAHLEHRLTWGESPMAEQTPPEHRQRILHSALRLPGGALIYAADKPAQAEACAMGDGARGFSGIALALEYEEIAAGEAAFAALADGGRVMMPMAESFWVERFGMVTDRYGVGWLINAGKPRL